MAINATCPHCKNAYEFTDDHAGRLFLCRKCSNTFDIPSNDPKTNDKSVLPPPVPLAHRQQFAPDYTCPSAHRIVAARICSVFGVLNILSCLCIGASGLLAYSITLPPQVESVKGIITIILAVMFFVSIGMAMLYFICGKNIRNGGFASVIIMLVVGSLNLLLTLFGLLNILVSGPPKLGGNMNADRLATASTTYWISVAIQAIFLILFAKLLLTLISILGEKHQPRLQPSLA